MMRAIIVLMFFFIISAKLSDCTGDRFVMCGALFDATQAIIDARDALHADLRANSYTDNETMYFDMAWVAYGTLTQSLNKLADFHRSQGCRI